MSCLFYLRVWYTCNMETPVLQTKLYISPIRPKLVRNQPRLSFYYAWILLASSRLNKAESYVQNAEHILPVKPDTKQTATKNALNLLGMIDAIRACFEYLLSRKPDTDV